MMKRMICIVAVLALCAPVLAQETLELRVVVPPDLTSVDAGAGGTFDVEIQGRLNTSTSEGLALWGVNITTSGSTHVGFDLCTDMPTIFAPLAFPDGSAYFEKNRGLTNPDGFGGTCDGAHGLWQIGGGQNTIGNTGPTAYPFGPIVTGFGNGTTYVTLAEGQVTIPALSDNLVLTLDTGFANTIDLPAGAGPVYDVSLANVSIIGDLTFTPPAGEPPYIVGQWKTWANHGQFPANLELYHPINQAGAPTQNPYTGIEPRRTSISKLTCEFSEPIVLPLASAITMDGCVNGPYNPTSVALDGTGTILTMNWTGIPNGLNATTPDIYVVTINPAGLIDVNDGLELTGDNDIEIWGHFGNVWLLPIPVTRYKTNATDYNNCGNNYASPIIQTSVQLRYDVWDLPGIVTRGKVNATDYNNIGNNYTDLPCTSNP